MYGISSVIKMGWGIIDQTDLQTMIQTEPTKHMRSEYFL